MVFTNTAAAFNVKVLIVRETSSNVRYTVAATQTGSASFSTNSFASAGQLTGLTLSSANTLKVTGTASGTGAAVADITAKVGAVEYIP